MACGLFLDQDRTLDPCIGRWILITLPPGRSHSWVWTMWVRGADPLYSWKSTCNLWSSLCMYMVALYLRCYICGFNLPWIVWLSLLLLFSHPVVSDALGPHGLQPARPPCPSPGPEVCPSSLESVALVVPSSHLILCHPPLLPPLIFLSIWDFSNELSDLIRWPKHWSFSISPSNKYSWLISLKIDWIVWYCSILLLKRKFVCRPVQFQFLLFTA